MNHRLAALLILFVGLVVMFGLLEYLPTALLGESHSQVETGTQNSPHPYAAEELPSAGQNGRSSASSVVPGSPTCSLADGALRVEGAFAKPLFTPGVPQTNYLKVGITGLRPDGEAVSRLPYNLAIVIDRSGSMGGRKIEDAKAAALYALDQLATGDLFSLIVFSGATEVYQMASPWPTNAESARSALRNLFADGSTDLYTALERAKREVLQHATSGRLNRILLLSDGCPTSGRQDEDSFLALASDLARSGITLSTFGLGLDYNQELLSRTARLTEGNHAFIADTGTLPVAFAREFGDMRQANVKDIRVTVTCRHTTFARSLGREAAIVDGTATTVIPQGYIGQEKYLLLEMPVPAEASAQTLPAATIRVSYTDTRTGIQRELSGHLNLGCTRDIRLAEKTVNEDSLGAALRQKIDAVYKQARDFLRRGDRNAAAKACSSNIREIQRAKAAYANMRVLLGAVEMYNMDACTMLQKSDQTPEQQEALLKSMEENLHRGATQQSW